MRIALVHDSLNPSGGAERLALAFAEVLKKAGHSVDLYVLERTLWERVEKLTPYARSLIDREYVLPPYKMLPSIYSRLLNWFCRDIVGIHKVKRRRYNLVIATKQLLVPVFVDIIYMHFPDFVPGFDYLYYPDRYAYNTALRIYSRPMELLTRSLMFLFKNSEFRPLVLTNSKFSASLIRRFLGVEVLVVYPPVDVKKYLPFSKNSDRDDIVVTVSRIEPMKNLDLVLDVAKEVKAAKFVIIGTVDSHSYYSNLLKRVETSTLKGRVKILTNVDEEQRMELLRRAKVYFHPTKYEHFGISIVEAMSAGLVPVVHKSGGPWIDILGKTHGVYGYAYENIDEATAIISSLLNEEGLRTELSKRAVERARLFDFKTFEKNMLKIVESFLKQSAQHKHRRNYA